MYRALYIPLVTIALVGQAGAQDRASRLAEVYWAETQTALVTSRSATHNNRMSLVPVDAEHYRLEIVLGWDRSDHLEDRRAEVEAAFGAEVPLSSYSTVRVERVDGRFDVVVANESYHLIATVEVRQQDCGAEVRYRLNSGQDHFEMPAVETGQRIRFRSIDTRAVRCVLDEVPSARYRGDFSLSART